MDGNKVCDWILVENWGSMGIWVLTLLSTDSFKFLKCLVGCITESPNLYKQGNNLCIGCNISYGTQHKLRKQN